MTNAVSRTESERGRIPELDGIRGLAILMVLVWHYLVSQYHAPPGSTVGALLSLLNLTWSGVDLFFVLSGLLIGGILLDNRGSPAYFRTFYARRVCRILPLYYAFFALFVLAVEFLPAAIHDRWAWLMQEPLPLWSYATFTQNLVMAGRNTFGANFAAPTWSLAIEEQFYLLLPLLIRLAPRPWLDRIVVGGILAAIPVRAALLWLSGGGRVVIHVLLPSRMDALLLGVALALVFRSPSLQRLYERRGWLSLLLVVQGLLLWPLLAIPVEALAFWGYSLLALFYATLVLRVRLGAGEWWGTVFRTRPLVYLGTISYGVYLLHQVVSGALHATFFRQSPRITTLSHAAVTGAALVVTLALCGVSWRFFERPTVEWGRQFRY